jgi:hypothetical protein
VRLLRMDDRPRLVERVDEGARRQRRPTLVKRSPDTDVAVGQGEDRLGAIGVPLGPPRFDDPPLVWRKQVLGRRDDLAIEDGPR